jgi:cyanophycin synthetase
MARGVSNWRRIETRVALVRSTGLVHGVRSWRRDRVLARLVPGRRRQIARALWAEAAAELGAEVVELAPNHFEIRLGAAATRVRGQTVSLNDAETAERAGDKPHVYRLLTDAGLRVPDHETFRASELARVREFLARGPLPCVVKPTRGSGGDGVTGGIRTVRELKRAAGWAARYSSSLLIERQAPGDVFRLLVLGADVLDVVWRRPPTVTGDGRSTIGDLIFAEYDRRICGDRAPGIKPFAADLDCILTLDHQGLSLRSVPADGAAIQVKSVTNYNRPLDNESVTAAISERCRADAVTAAHAAGLRLAGIDIVTPPATTHADGTHVVIDVNPFPALHHHLHVENPGPTSKVAVPILQELLRPPRR